MYHSAAAVIVELSVRCRRAAVNGNQKEAVRLADIAADLEREFPEAAAEIHALYPQPS